MLLKKINSYRKVDLRCLTNNVKEFIGELMFTIGILSIPAVMAFLVFLLGVSQDKQIEIHSKAAYIENGLFANEDIFIEVHSETWEDPVFYVKTNEKQLLVTVNKKDNGSYSETIKEID